MKRLHQELPAQDEAGIEEQARAVLRYVLTGALADLPVECEPATCPNCGGPCNSKRSPYCSEACRETAGFVRQFRTGLSEGWIFDPAKQVALGQVLWHVLGGGRPLRLEIAPAKARERAFLRDGGLCQVCGTRATTVDHVGSGCNRPCNLRAVCDTCCRDRAFGDPRITSRECFAQTIQGLASRIAADKPVRVCDDALTWDWRAYLLKRV